MNEKALRKLVAEEFQVLDGPEPSDDECRYSCSTILKALDVFLSQPVITDLPIIFLRETVSRILQEIGPGDTLFRTRWSAVLENAKSIESLKFALEFVRCAIPPKNDDASNEVIRSLELMSEAHHEVMPEIFQCLQVLVRSQKLSKKAAFDFFVNHLSNVPNACMEDPMDCLLDHASDDDDWVRVIEILRGEVMGARGGIDDDDAENVRPSDRRVCISSAIIKFHQDQRYNRFFEEYLALLEDLCARRVSDDGVVVVKGLNELDLVILLLHRDHTEHGTHVEQILNDAVRNGSLDSRAPAFLSRLLWVGHDDDADSRRLLVLHLHSVWLLIFLCVGPLRSPKICNAEVVASLALEYGCVLLQVSRGEGRQRVVSALLQVNEQCLHLFSQSDASNLDNPEEKILAIQRVQAVVVEILMTGGPELAIIVKREMTTLIHTLSSRGVTVKTVANLCRILISADDSEGGIFALTRELLFANCGDSNCYKEESSKDELKLRGLILMTEMVNSKKYCPNRLSLLWQSLRRVLLPPTDRLLDPRIGIYGLEAIRSFHAWLQSGDDESTFVLHSEIFPTMTSILMNARLVQYANATRKSVSRDTVKLGYSVLPEFYRVHGAKQRSYHKMIFSFEALLNDQILLSPGHWNLRSRWVHDLIDTYLTLGRTKSKGKWIPHAWVEAAFDFTVADISCLQGTNMRQQRMLETVGRALQEYDVCNATQISMTFLDKDFGDALKQGKVPLDRSKLVLGLLQSSTSYCFALALSAGILENTFAHYSGLLGSQDEKRARERNEATRMMQYQLAKIYDLVEKCQMLECIFRGIAGVSHRGTRRHKRGNRGRLPSSIFGNILIDNAVHRATETLPPIISAFSSTNEYVRTEILWHCLVDPSNDNLIIEKIEQEFRCSGEAMEMDFTFFDVIVDLRLRILHQLTAHLSSYSKRNLNEKPKHAPEVVRQELDKIQPMFAQCLRLAAYLSMKLSSQGHSGFQDGRLSKLTGSYFRLLLLSMEINLEGCSDDSKAMYYARYRGLYQSVMGSAKPLTEAAVTSASRQVSFKSILHPLVKHLSRCRDMRVVTELLETLSAFALYSNTRESIQEMVGISWTALHSSFYACNDMECNAGMPWALVEALKRLSPGVAGECSKLRALKDMAVRETILKSALRQSKTLEKNFFQLHGMVRHWGLLALAEKFSPICADHLHELFMNLQSFFSSMKEIQVPKPRVKKDDGSSGDDEYIPPKPRQSTVRPPVPESTVPGLGFKNHYAYFQVLLDMTVSSSALFTVNDGPDWVDPLNGPYRELCKVVETFGSLIVLYQKRISAFPQQTVSVVLNACRSMLNVVLYQCTACIEWRSSQRAPTADQIEAETFDAAAVQYLGRIFDVFGVHVIGTLDSLCTFFVDFANPSTRISTIGATFAPGHQQKVKALRVKASKVASELEKHASAHQLPSPRMVLSELEIGQPARKRRRIEIRGFLQFEESAEESEDTNHSASFSTMVPMSYGGTKLASNNDMYSSELTWDAGSSDDDDSFGADGDWGRESEEELEPDHT